MPSKKEAAWKAEYRQQVLKMNNKELWAEFLETQQPDDYDGCFTASQEFKAVVTKESVEEILELIGFFDV